MNIPKIPEGEYRLCRILWDREPIAAVELVRLAQTQLGWKRTTTYTVIKRLTDRGVLKLEDGVVTAQISREAVEASEIGDFVEKKFGGSLPAFVAAFAKHQRVSEKDLDQMQEMIDRIRRGGG